MRATMTVMGLYNWDNDLFDQLTVPDDVDAGLAVASILTDNATLEVMYPDPDIMAEMIGIWSARESVIWDRIYKAISKTYDPLENYNRTESWNQTDTGTSSATSGNTTTNKVAGYNDTVLATANQTEDHSSGNGSSSLQSYRSSNVKGNIGVTSSQQLLNQELDVSERLDIYKYISQSFKQRFCLMVY